MHRLRYVILIILVIAQSISFAQVVEIVQPFTDTMLCTGKSFQLHYTTLGAFQPGNIFTAELSDGGGSFATPVPIGSASSGGYIPVTIPLGLSTSNFYRIRIVASAPVINSQDNGRNIRIEPPPLAPIISNNSPVCENDTLVVDVTNAQSSLVDSLVWSGGIFTTPAQGPKTLQYNSAQLGLSGTYTIIRYSKATKCASAPATTGVYVQQLPPKPIATGPALVCEGSPVQLNASTPATVDGYKWTGPGGFQSTLQDPYIDKMPATQAGWHIVHSILGGCYSGKSDSVLVNVLPAPRLAKVTNAPVCEGENLLVSAKDTGNISYTWKGPNGFQVMNPEFSISKAEVKTTGMYYIHTIKNGCDGVDSLYIRIKQRPFPVILNANSPVCEGDTLRINSVQLAEPAPVNYSFTGPGGFIMNNSSAIIANVTTTSAGTYVLKGEREGCVQTDTLSVMVKPTPIVTTNKEFMVTIEQPVTLTANSNIPGTTFSWTGPNGFVSAEQNPVIKSVTEFNKGLYTATGTYEGCSSDTTTELGVWYPTDYTWFEIQPNANDGTFLLTGRVKKPQIVEIGVFAAETGVAIYKDKIQSNGKLVSKSITLHSHLVNGVYILKARADGDFQSIKFVVMR